MELKVDITPECIEKFTSDTMTIIAKDKISFNGKEATAVPCEPIYSGFANFAIHLLTLSAGISRHTTVNATTKEVVEWVSMERNLKTEKLFEPFKKTGVYVSKLTCGMCLETGVTYLSTKLCKELSRLSDFVKAEMFAYIYSLSKFIIAQQKDPIVANVGYLGKYDVGLTVEEFANRLPKFPKEGQVHYVRDISSDDVIELTYDKSGLSSITSSFTGTKSLKFAVLNYKGKSFYGVCLVKLASKSYAFVVASGRVATDYDMCLLELASDSLCTFIATSIKAPNVVFKRLDTTFNSDYELLSGDDQEALTTSLPGWLAHWCKNMYHVGAEYVADEDLKYFTAQGVKLEGGFEVGDPESIRKAYEDDEYAQELYKQVHAYYDTFDLGNVAANAKGFSTGAIYSMAFVGASGTGKSTAARVLPTRCGLPYVSVNFSVNIEEADLFGAMVPNPKKASADDPEFVWQDGIITRAVRNGYCAVLEEINFARPGVLGKLNSLLDENRQIDLSNGEIVKAHPNFRMIATCNIAYEGTNRFNKALINRFDDVTVFEDPEREAAIKIIKERTGYSNITKLARIYDMYEALKKFIKEQGIDAVVSMRQLLNIFTKGKYYKDARDAVKRIILNGAFIEDVEYQAAFEETVLPAFDLKFKI